MKHFNDLDNMFVINFSQFSSENRWDPEFFSPKYQENLKRISWKKSEKLADLVSFSNETWDQKSIFTDFFHYIEISSIDLSSGNISNTKCVKIDDAPSRAKMIVRNGDILVSTTRPSRGAISLYNNDEVKVASTGFSIIRNLKEDSLSKEALFCLLKMPFSLLQMKQRSSGGNYPAITQAELGKIIIPIPSHEEQSQIVDLYQSVLALRNKKISQSDLMLNRLYDDVLNSLGIVLDDQNNSISDRVFKRMFSDLVGRRFDPIYYNSDLEQFNKGKFTPIKLKTLIIEFSSGQGVGRQDQASEEEGVLQIRPTNLGPQGSFVFEKNVFVPDEARHKRLQKGDVIFNNTNSQELVGKSAYWDIDLEATYSNHITVLRVDETKIFPEYLALILNLYQKSNIFYSICTNWNNQSGVGIDVLLDLNIPLPPLALQEEIISHIRQIRDEAKKLKDEANLVLENAKQEIERIILGETE